MSPPNSFINAPNECVTDSINGFVSNSANTHNLCQKYAQNGQIIPTPDLVSDSFIPFIQSYANKYTNKYANKDDQAKTDTFISSNR